MRWPARGSGVNLTKPVARSAARAPHRPRFGRGPSRARSGMGVGPAEAACETRARSASAVWLRLRDLTRDGNGYPKPETRWVFTPLGYGFGPIFIPMGLLMGINLYPTGLWVRVCSYSTQTREPVGFLNPTKPSAYCHFIL
jgi:hypothetical protein